MIGLPWRKTTPKALCNAIAHAGLGTATATASPTTTNDSATAAFQPAPADPLPTHRLGSITLHPHQQEAVTRVQSALAKHRGALLADAVGLGKTYVALATANRFDHAHIIAPAALLPMWKDALRHCGCHHASLHSLHTLSRRPVARCTLAGACLVIVDEAHHLRTRNTLRYANAALFTAGKTVLLLSATPLHNRPRDIRNILALFLGHRADSADDTLLGEVVIRRTTGVAASGALPVVREHTPFAIASNPAVLECLLTLPPPLPTRDGAPASALVRLGLLRAWCSSDAALTSTIRQRQLRGEALLHSLVHGRYPSAPELRSWITGHDAIQLGFAELLAPAARHDVAPFIRTLTAHLDALQNLLQLHTRSARADGERIAQLRALLVEGHEAIARGSRPTAPPMIAFSQFASTVHALHRALGDLAGIARLTATGGHIASGPIGRNELLAQFAPRAHERPPPPAHQHIQLLLTTDLLSEGVNLQDAGRLIHLDLPWTDAARTQRVGRLARLASPHKAIDVFTFAPPPGIDATLRIVETLARKARDTSRVVGAPDPPHAATEQAPSHESGPELATRVDARLRRWRTAPATDNSARHFAVVPARRDGWMAVVSYAGATCAVARTSHAPHASHAGESFTHLAAALDVIDERDVLEERARTELASDDDQQSRLDAALTELREYWNDTAARDATGPLVRSVSDARRNALRALGECTARIPAPLRRSLASPIRVAERVVRGVCGAGEEGQLEEWLATRGTLAPSAWLAAIGNYELLRACAAATGDDAPGARMPDRDRDAQADGVASAMRVHALLLLVARE